MPDPTPEDSLSRSVKKLTAGIWVLVVLVALQLLLSLWTRIQWSTTIEHAVESAPVRIPSTRFSISEESHFNLSDLPLEQQVEKASVIALANWKSEGGRLKCIIVEILKHAPGTTFHYKVGDEFQMQSMTPKPDTLYGEGQVIFFVGSPASMRYATTHDNGRILGMGDMPLELLREAIRKQAK